MMFITSTVSYFQIRISFSHLVNQGFLLRQWVKGPFVVALEVFHKPCKEYWWANLLYINNLVPWKGDKICNTESWYLSNDMQFYILAPIFIYLLFRSPMLGMFYICEVKLCLVPSGIIATLANFQSRILCLELRRQDL